MDRLISGVALAFIVLFSGPPAPAPSQINQPSEPPFEYPLVGPRWEDSTMYKAGVERARQIDAEIAAAKAACEAIGNIFEANICKTPPPPPKALTAAPRTPRGDWVAQCQEWAKQLGIGPLSPAAVELIDRESDCDPGAVNPSSGACGIGQDINGCSVGPDPLAQLKWMYDYVIRRYGSWESALAHHDAKNWY